MSIDEKLKKYDLFLTLSKISSLLTIPSLASNSYRIEKLIHLVVSNCKKSSISPEKEEIEIFLNKDLDQYKSQEDPIEDVFVTNIITLQGSFRIFEGLWESNDFYVQKTIESLFLKNENYKELLLHIFNLLRLSDEVVQRSGLKRWDYSEETSPKQNIKISKLSHEMINRVVFDANELFDLNIHIDLLKPFFFTKNDIKTSDNQNHGCSELKKKPFICIEGKIIVALPNAIGAAIRHYIISEFKKTNYTYKFDEIFFENEINMIEGLLSPLRAFNVVRNPNEQKDKRSSSLVKSWILKYDSDKYLCILLFHISVQQEPLINNTDKISNEIKKMRDFCKSQNDFVSGTVLILPSCDGLNTIIEEIPDLADNSWCYSCIKTQDFLKLGAPIDKTKWSLKNYLKFLDQKKYFENQGRGFSSINGDYALYCSWHTNCTLIMDHNQSLFICCPDIVFPLNKDIRKLLDIHCTKDIDGKYFPVLKSISSSYHREFRKLPICTDLYPLFYRNILRISVENNTPKWLSIKCASNFMKIACTLLSSGLDVLYYKIVHEIENILKDQSHITLEICLNFENIKLDQKVFDEHLQIEKTETIFDFSKNRAEIKFPYNFFLNFNTTINKGEREIAKHIVSSLISLCEKKEKSSDSRVNSIVNKIVQSDNKILHLFPDDGSVFKFVQNKNINFNFERTIADNHFVRFKILQDFQINNYNFPLIEQEVQKFLHDLFEYIRSHIKSKLKLFNKSDVIHKLMEIYESQIHEDSFWRRIMRAFLSYAEESKNVAEEKSRNRDNIKKSIQILLEMSICECLEDGGKILSEWDMEELLEESLFLLEVSFDSDLIEYNFSKKEIKRERDGLYSIDREFLYTGVLPFMQGIRYSQQKDQSQNYKEFYNNTQSRNEIESAFKTEFEFSRIENAFKAEFGISTKDMAQIYKLLFQIANEKSSVVVKTTIGEIKKKCKEEGISCETIQHFMNSFVIFSRDDWNIPPVGFKNRDILPSKYNRRLALNVRPLLATKRSNDGNVFYGMGNFERSICYLFDQIEEGNFPIHFFKSNEMKSLCGNINKQKGEQFNQKVADKVQESHWKVKLNLKMSTLGASKSLGDIDVLAWKDNRVKIIESKRLQLSRNLNEIFNSLERMKKIRKKHTNRLNWIKNNYQSIYHIVGFTPAIDSIEGCIVTDYLMPSQYINDLDSNALPIIQIDLLGDFL